MKSHLGKVGLFLAGVTLALAGCSNPASNNNEVNDDEASLNGVLCFGELSDEAPCYWDGSTTAISLDTIGDASYNFVASIARSISSVVAAGYYYNSTTDEYEPRQWEGQAVYALPVGTGNTGGFAYCAAVNGTDIYAGGNIKTSSATVPALWKNRELRALVLPAGMAGGGMTAMTTLNDSVYVAGRYWTNGNVTSLFGIQDEEEPITLALPVDADSGFVSGIAGSGTTIRFVGYYIFLDGSAVPCWWDENGARTDLPIPSGFASAQATSAVFVGSDLYIAGNTLNASAAGSSMRAMGGGVTKYCYWKNGTPAILEAPAGYLAEIRKMDVQNAYGQAAFVGTIQDINDDSFHCAWVGGTPHIIGPVYSYH